MTAGRTKSALFASSSAFASELPFAALGFRSSRGRFDFQFLPTLPLKLSSAQETK